MRSIVLAVLVFLALPQIIEAQPNVYFQNRPPFQNQPPNPCYLGPINMSKWQILGSIYPYNDTLVG
jgi:hypothetical protein